MDNRSHKVFHYIPDAITTIRDDSIDHARILGHAKVEPLVVLDRIMDIHYAILCRECLYSDQGTLQCKALKSCISAAINRVIPVTRPATYTVNPVTRPANNTVNPDTRPADPPLSSVVAFAVRTANITPAEGQVSSMRDVERLFVYLLEAPGVKTVIEEAGFSASVIKNNVLNGGTVFNCTSEP